MVWRDQQEGAQEKPITKRPGSMRQFEGGATRDTDADKPHYIGYWSWLAMKRFGAYMLRHEVQSDGTRRQPGNWKLGIPREAYRDSLARHFVDFNAAVEEERLSDAEELACAMLFNVQGWLHEHLRQATRQGVPPIHGLPPFAYGAIPPQ